MCSGRMQKGDPPFKVCLECLCPEWQQRAQQVSVDARVAQESPYLMLLLFTHLLLKFTLVLFCFPINRE